MTRELPTSKVYGPLGECPCDGCCATPAVRSMDADEFARDPADIDSAWADIIGWMECTSCGARCFCNA